MNMNDNNNVPTEPVTQAPVEPVAPVAATTTPAPVQAQAPQLPDDTRDRTRNEFEKLIESNRRLAEENARLAEMSRATRQPAPTAPSTSQAVDPNDFIETNPISGEKYLNDEKLRNKLNELNTKASRAEQIIQSYMEETQRKEIQSQNDEAFAAYPELNPTGDKYDTTFVKQVRGILQDSMWNAEEYGGRPLSFKAAADFVRQQNTPKVVAAPVVDEKAAKAASDAAQAAKEQSSAQATGQPGNNARENLNDQEELKSLIYRTRYLNDDKALAERIKHTEHILPREGN